MPVLRRSYDDLAADMRRGDDVVTRFDVRRWAEEVAVLGVEAENVRHALAWALTYMQDDAPESGEAREDYTGATRLAWPDSPEQWAPENAS